MFNHYLADMEGPYKWQRRRE